jgi:5-methylcytosine-specific restriction endonuclease McrA
MHEAIEHFLKANTKERAAIAEVVSSLIPIMDDKLYVQEGYSSLFAFLTNGCQYSEASAYRRIAAAKVVKLRRESLELLQAGKLTLCSMAEMAKVITEENADTLLAVVQGLSKRKTEAVVAKALPPVAVRRERIRKVNVAPRKAPAPLLPPVAAENSMPLFAQEQTPAPALQEVQPKTSVMTSYSFLADEEFDALLQAVKAYTGHQPLVDVLKAAMRSYLREKAPKSAQTRKYNKKGRHVPKYLRQAVLERDGGRCCFVSESGVRCCSEAGLQIDHIVPFAKGGRTEESNLRTLCKAHNLHMAEAEFGREKVYFHQRKLEVGNQSISG